LTELLKHFRAKGTKHHECKSFNAAAADFVGFPGVLVAFLWSLHVGTWNFHCGFVPIPALETA
jgi:hypothetical protein